MLVCINQVKGGEGGRTARQEVLVADVKGSVGVRGEDGLGFADDVSGAAVLVAEGIADL